MRPDSIASARPLDAETRASGKAAQRDEPVACPGLIAPAREPGGLKTSACLGIGDGEAAGKRSRVGAHIGDALVIGGTLRAGDAAAGTAEVAGDDGEIDAGGRDLGGIAVAIRPTGYIVGDRLIDQGRRVRPVSRLASAARRIEGGCLSNLIGRNAGRLGD